MGRQYNKIREYNIVSFFESPIVFGKSKVYADYIFSRRKEFGENVHFWVDY